MLLSGEYPPLSQVVNPICLDLCEITEPLEGFLTLECFLYSSMLQHCAKKSKQSKLLSIIYTHYTGMKADFWNFLANLLKKKTYNVVFA